MVESPSSERVIMAVICIESPSNGAVVSHVASTRRTHREEGEARRAINSAYHPHPEFQLIISYTYIYQINLNLNFIYLSFTSRTNSNNSNHGISYLFQIILILIIL